MEDEATAWKEEAAFTSERLKGGNMAESQRAG